MRSRSTRPRGAQVAGPGIWRWDIVVLGPLAADLRLRREPLQVHNSLCPAKAIGQAWGHPACSPPGQVLASCSRAPGSSPPARLSAGPRPWLCLPGNRKTLFQKSLLEVKKRASSFPGAPGLWFLRATPGCLVAVGAALGTPLPGPAALSAQTWGAGSPGRRDHSGGCGDTSGGSGS